LGTAAVADGGNPGTSRWAAALGWLVPLGVSAAFVRRIDDLDIWYHLVIGREIWESGRIPSSEFFVHTLAGQPARFHEWGFGLLFFAAHRMAGFWGMALLNAALGGVALYGAYRAARRAGAGEAACLAGVGLLAGFLYYRVAYRPEALLFAALAASLYVLERHLADGRIRWLAAVPAIAFLLGQGHPSAIFVLFVAGCYGVQAVVGDRVAGRSGRGPGLRFLVVSVATVGASLANPYGLAQLSVPFSFASEIQAMGIMEFVATWSTGYRWPLVALAIVAAASILVARGRRAAYALIGIAFGYLAFRHVRNVALFALATYLPATLGLEALLGRVGALSRLGGAGRTAAAAALALATSWATAWKVGAWGAGPIEGAFPEAAARTIERLRPEGRLFNYYDHGGYLAWRLFDRGYPVSIDGRHYVRDASLLLHGEVFFEGGPWRERLEAHDVAAVVTPATSRFSGRLVLLVSDLDADPDWDLASAEPAGLLFVRRGRVPGSHPLPALDKDEIWRQAIREAEAVVARFPDHPFAYQSLGVAFFKLGRFAESAARFRDYLALRPADRETAGILSWIEAAERGDPEAREHLLRLRAGGRSRRTVGSGVR
jgi:hypothetical protein